MVPAGGILRARVQIPFQGFPWDRAVIGGGEAIPGLPDYLALLQIARSLRGTDF